MWSLRKILQILYQLYRQADYRLPPVSRLIRERRLRFSGHVWTLNRISIGSLGRRSDHPVIGGDFGWGRLIGLLMYGQSTSGSSQPGESPATAHSGDVSSTRPTRYWKRRKLDTCMWLGSRVGSVLDSGAVTAWVQIAVATMSGNSLRQTFHTDRASVHQAAKLVAPS